MVLKPVQTFVSDMYNRVEGKTWDDKLSCASFAVAAVAFGYLLRHHAPPALQFRSLQFAYLDTKLWPFANGFLQQFLLPGFFVVFTRGTKAGLVLNGMFAHYYRNKAYKALANTALAPDHQYVHCVGNAFFACEHLVGPLFDQVFSSNPIEEVSLEKRKTPNPQPSFSIPSALFNSSLVAATFAVYLKYAPIPTALGIATATFVFFKEEQIQSFQKPLLIFLRQNPLLPNPISLLVNRFFTWILAPKKESLGAPTSATEKIGQIWNAAIDVFHIVSLPLASVRAMRISLRAMTYFSQCRAETPPHDPTERKR